ncbi:MAG: GDP-mannose 4,6-dehydratase, partial [Dehalococcoidia bacterium]|nr:GDP-mannose 4,6-dehydratase [Dehalococcoidia bacterium]
MQRYLVTGGAGFIGSNFVRLLLRERPDSRVVVLDKLTYAGNLANLRDVLDDPRVRFVRADIADADAVHRVIGDERVDVIVNFAAETHLDR